ncbi:restriction endonuclease [Arcobacter cryaerophilus gv. occultus]|uniref:restriction endonuclease subunit S n=1 Tax=Aliarcobacter cryaerophilus TaxID=28198 RepID=UPI000D01830E|nr:restriction endonuclease subunit S [Aliarcobacter cryaerophilus]PRM91441.1 restriction endonuclease [Arcobacter cryaerophilus gv. occultus]
MSKKVKFKTIFDFCSKSKIKASEGLPNGDFPFYTSSQNLSKFINEANFRDTEALIFGTGGLASIHYANTSFSTSTDCFVTKLKNNDFFLKYIYYYLSGNIYILENGFKGAGLKHISKKYIEDIEIPFPSLEQQKQIAKTLDKANELIELRKESITKLDALAKSIFIDMFGDPVSNPKGWKVDNFGETIDVLTDYHANGSYEILKKHVELLDTKDYALMIRTTDLENHNFDIGVKYITEKAYKFLKKTKVYGGEIIMNKIGSAGSVFLMPKLNKPVSLGMNQFLIRLNSKANEVFLFHLLKTEYGKKSIERQVRGAVTKSITKDAVRDIKIILPTIEMQNKFAKIIEKIEEQKSLYEKELKKLEENFQALLQKSFQE